ncbi:MAG: glycosyltransferase family 4 protein [Alphaproteobacteria bacterium]|nr:glycosyltransferase family 4 protein [Alphaproteobacteria bacterium]
MPRRPDRLRVATFYSYMCSGGDENRVLQYLGSRDDSRFELFVINGIQPDPDSEALNGPMQQRVRDTGVELINLGIPSDHQRRVDDPGLGLAADQAKNFARMVRRLARVLKEKQIDLVDGRNNMGTLVGTWGAKLAGTRAVVSTNYELTRFHPPGWRQLGQATYRMVDALVCDSDACLDDMRDWMRWPPPGFCVPNGIIPPAPTRDAADMRAELGIPADAVVIGEVARVQRIKGQDLLLEAGARLVKEFPKAFFLIVGYPQQAQDYQDDLRRIVAQNQMEDRVAFVSYPGPIGDLWQLIDIHAHPTRQDSSPIALMEGMSLGKPVVTTLIGGIHEIITNEETGLLIDADDGEALYRSLRRLLGEPAFAARLGAAAKARHRKNHSQETMARNQEAVYDEVWAAPFRGR